MTDDEAKAGTKWATPTINMNGTAKDDLLDALSEVIRAIIAAEVRVHEASPHARDYLQSGRPDDRMTYTRARIEHIDRLVRLGRVRLEFEEIAAAIMDQGK